MYFTDECQLYIDDITDTAVIYHFEGEKSYTAKLYDGKKGRKYFQVLGNRYYLDEFEKAGDE